MLIQRFIINLRDAAAVGGKSTHHPSAVSELLLCNESTAVASRFVGNMGQFLECSRGRDSDLDSDSLNTEGASGAVEYYLRATPHRAENFICQHNESIEQVRSIIVGLFVPTNILLVGGKVER